MFVRLDDVRASMRNQHVCQLDIYSGYLLLIIIGMLIMFGGVRLKLGSARCYIFYAAHHCPSFN
jgi:hypothetical protein